MNMLGDQPAVILRDLTIEVPGRRLLDGIDLRVLPSESVAIMGPSGSGKTSLLNCVAGIQNPTAGDVSVAGRRLGEMNEAERARFRLNTIGMIFQFGELLPELTVTENVELPLRLAGRPRTAARSAAAAVLGDLGLGDVAASFTETLSGGEVQRAGIARALAASPQVLLADEPTGALDEDNAAAVMTLLLDCAKRYEVAVLVATHDLAVARQCTRTYRLVRGKLRQENAGE
ncbi:ABC transporter ATP-binding protein [Actinoplanes sp. CA-131856]